MCVQNKLEPYTEPWQDLVFGPVFCDVASVEGDPVSVTYNTLTHSVCQNLRNLDDPGICQSVCHMGRLCKNR